MKSSKDIFRDITSIYQNAIRSADGGAAVRKCLGFDGRIMCIDSGPVRFDTAKGDVYVVGAGKAVAAMAEAVEEILGDCIAEGVIAVKYGHTKKLFLVRQIEAAHPVPDEHSVLAAKEIHSLVSSAGENDCILSLLSGGASALASLPAEGISLDDLRLTTEFLLSSGAPIDEINCIRKHLSSFSGGRLAKAGYPASVINLCISDVLGDDLSVIASGPFYPDLTTFSEALDILDRYDLIDRIPVSVKKILLCGAHGNIEETPESADRCFSRVVNHICMSNTLLMKTAEETASAAGYKAVILSAAVAGDTSVAALCHADAASNIRDSGAAVGSVCLLSGGETTVCVKGRGKGGRNMEFVLRTALALEAMDDLYIASVGSDGTDGPTDAAGAWISTSMMRSFRAQGIIPESFAAENDSYSYFEKTGTLIKTGPTGTNVLDLHIIIV